MRRAGLTRSCTCRNTATSGKLPGCSIPPTSPPTPTFGKQGEFWPDLGDASESFSPRQAFIRAVAGQPPRGYERAVLERGQAPLEFTQSVGAVEVDRLQRQATLDETNRDPEAIYRSVPKLSPGVRIERKPVLGQGRFDWGQVICGPGQSQGTPCSPLVALLVSMIDGETPVAAILESMGRGRQPDQAQQISQSALAALGILYVDGSIDRLAGL